MVGFVLKRLLSIGRGLILKSTFRGFFLEAKRASGWGWSGGYSNADVCFLSVNSIFILLHHLRLTHAALQDGGGGVFPSSSPEQGG